MPKKPAPIPWSFEAPEDSPGLLLWRVSNRWQRHMRQTLEPLGLTHVQFVLLASLAWLTRDGQPVSQARLAQHARADAMMTSQVVRALQTKGLLLRNPSRADSRAFELLPSERGLDIARDAVVAVEAADRAFFAALADSRPFLRALRELAE